MFPTRRPPDAKCQSKSILLDCSVGCKFGRSSICTRPDDLLDHLHEAFALVTGPQAWVDELCHKAHVHHVMVFDRVIKKGNRWRQFVEMFHQCCSSTAKIKASSLERLCYTCRETVESLMVVQYSVYTGAQLYALQDQHVDM